MSYGNYSSGGGYGRDNYGARESNGGRQDSYGGGRQDSYGGGRQDSYGGGRSYRDERDSNDRNGGGYGNDRGSRDSYGGGDSRGREYGRDSRDSRDRYDSGSGNRGYDRDSRGSDSRYGASGDRGGYGGSGDRGGYGGSGDRDRQGGRYGDSGSRGDNRGGYGSRDRGGYGGGGDRGGDRGGYGGGGDHGGYGGGGDRGGYGSRDRGGYGGGGRGRYGSDPDRFAGGRGFIGGGRGGRGRGGRGGRGNRQMGDVSSIKSLLNSAPGMTNEEIAPITTATVSPDRNSLVTDPQLPTLEPWRYENPIGAKMDPASTDKVVRANFFKVDKHAIPAKIFQYHVHLYRINKDGTVSEEDVAAFEDHRTTHALMNELLVQGEKTEDLEVRDLILSWPQCTRQSMTYDGASCLFTTSPLAMKETVNKKGDKISQISIVLTLPASMGGINNNQYKMSFTKTAVITAGEGCVTDCQAETLRALDTALLSFGRVQQTRDMPDWVVAGTKAFRFNTGADGRDQLNLTGAYEALRGYTASLKSTVAGLCLVSDMNVSSFLSAGELTHVMALAAGFRSIESFYQECRRGLNSKTVSMINDVLKGAKIKVTYNNQWRKFKKLGPPANSRDSVFEVYENEKVPKKVTVAEYFSEKSRGDDELGKAFRKFMEKNELRYPSLPTVDIGSQKRPVLIPAEMIVVPGGQIRSKKLSAEITASIIKYAAVKPAERFHFLSSDIGGGGNFVNILKNDPTASAYGMHGLETEPMKCSARLLPPPNIQYANCVETPGFAGTWNLEGKKFVQPPVSEMGDNKFKYGILGVGRPPHKWEDSVDSFMGSLVGDARTLGVQLIAGGPHLACGDAPHNIGEAIGKMKEGGAHIVFVVLFFDVYRIVKLQGDSLGMITQCLKWKNVMKPPRGYCSNVMLKVNAKLGGLNHVLTDRRDNKAPMASWGTSPSGAASEPPSSISWLFEKPCMIMGVNVSLSDPIKKDASLTTVIVASMDRACAKYVAHVQSSKSADTNQLSRAAEAVTTGFKNRNGTVPETVIIYRDGVSDGEFSKVVDVELEQIKDGLVAAGCVPDVKITVIICQKGHHTRLVYEEPDASASGGSSTFVNPAPGLVVDASDHESTIVSARYNEFYLNSHAAIQGTAKPCRYSLIYDSVGLKMSEIELLSYWTCYLYARCNKSVSYATPAYYAHLAARRAKDYTSIGATRQDLENISDHFCGSGKSNEVPRSGMYFV